MTAPSPATLSSFGVISEGVRAEQMRETVRANNARQKDQDRRAQTHRATHPVFQELRRSILAADSALHDATSLTAIDTAVAALETDFSIAITALRNGATAALGKDT